MIGWGISVYKLPCGGDLPATPKPLRGERIAIWQTGLSGLDWLNQLVEEKKALYLGGNGYPLRYTAQAQYLVPRLDPPPEANEVWVYDEDDDDAVDDTFVGRTLVDMHAALDCRCGEWLLVEAYDES